MDGKRSQRKRHRDRDKGLMRGLHRAEAAAQIDRTIGSSLHDGGGCRRLSGAPTSALGAVALTL